MSTKTHALLARYETPQAIYKACEKIRDAGYEKWDAYTPFPIHGMEHAMGLKASKLPWFVFGGGITGGTLAMSFMLWTSAYSYPINVGGKPLWSVPAFIPITFEITVLLSCITCFMALWFLCRLPQFYSPLFKSKAFERVTDDKFFIAIEASDKRFDLSKVRKLFEETGATLIEEVEE